MYSQAPAVLLVDDEASIHFVAGLFLREAGYFVDTANDGSDALRKFKRGGWDVVITDLSMPIMGGETLAREIRAISPQLPIILITGYLKPDTCRALFDDILEKPFSESRLLTSVKRVLSAVVRSC